MLPPVDYKKIWNSQEGSHGCQTGSSITIWEPIPPTGYIAMGHIVSEFNTKEELFDNAPIHCVPENCVIKIPIGPKIWDSEKLIKKDFSKNTFTPADRFILDLNCYLRQSTQRTKTEIMTKLNTFISSETTRLKSLKKDTKYKYCKVDIPYLIQELRNLREIDAIKNWNESSITSVYNGVNYIRNLAKEIEEKYQVSYSKMKNMLMKDIRKLDDKITPDVSASAPVYIFSAGADKAYEESLNIPGLKIDDDNGHNLFIACTSLKKAPKFAYKLNRACLYKKKIKPIQLDTIPGVLNFENDTRLEKGRSAEAYFTYPKDLILENLSSDYSPTTEPKRYYLSFSNKPVNRTKGDAPLYFIRAVNLKTKEYSLCKAATPSGKIIDTEIDISNERALFVIENENCIIYTFNDFQLRRPVRLRNYGMEGESPHYFDQFYNDNGKNIEKLKTDTRYTFKLKRV